jgi:energy-coupling factor transporter ATP-binding protein EcfA2
LRGADSEARRWRASHGGRTGLVRELPGRPGGRGAAGRETGAAVADAGWIVASGLTKRFGAVTAVDDLSFAAGPGLVTGFLGPNGAGKSTTLRMLLGLVTPDSGTATISGRRYPAFRTRAARSARCWKPTGSTLAAAASITWACTAPRAAIRPPARARCWRWPGWPGRAAESTWLLAGDAAGNGNLAVLAAVTASAAIFGAAGAGLGALAGGQLASVAGILIYLYIAEPLISRIGALHAWTAYLPGVAADGLTQGTQPGVRLLAPWAGGAVLAGWALALAAAGTIRTLRKDIT